jgi:hypothetical protein
VKHQQLSQQLSVLNVICGHFEFFHYHDLNLLYLCISLPCYQDKLWRLFGFTLGLKQGIEKHVDLTLFILVKSSNDNLINTSNDICHNHMLLWHFVICRIYWSLIIFCSNLIIIFVFGVRFCFMDRNVSNIVILQGVSSWHLIFFIRKLFTFGLSLKFKVRL